MCFNSSSVGRWPREFMTTSSSSIDIVPEQSVSNSRNASSNSLKITVSYAHMAWFIVETDTAMEVSFNRSECLSRTRTPQNFHRLVYTFRTSRNNWTSLMFHTVLTKYTRRALCVCLSDSFIPCLCPSSWRKSGHFRVEHAWHSVTYKWKIAQHNFVVSSNLWTFQ